MRTIQQARLGSALVRQPEESPAQPYYLRIDQDPHNELHPMNWEDKHNF